MVHTAVAGIFGLLLLMNSSILFEEEEVFEGHSALVAVDYFVVTCVQTLILSTQHSALSAQHGTPSVIFHHLIGACKAFELAFDRHQKEKAAAKAGEAKED